MSTPDLHQFDNRTTGISKIFTGCFDINLVLLLIPPFYFKNLKAMKILKTIILSIISILLLNTVNAQKEHKAYYDNGNIKEEGQFDTDGKGTGNWKFYSEDGTLSYTGRYEKGSPNGEFKFYN